MFGGSGNKADTVILHIEDPHARLALISFEDAHGKPIDAGITSVGSTQEFDQTFDFDKKLPSGARIKLFVATPKSITRVPFQLKDLQLP